MPHTPHLYVVPCQSSDQPRAAALAERLGLEVIARDQQPETGIGLQVDGAGVALQLAGSGAPGPVSVDFAAPSMRHRRRAGANELLGRAVGVTGTRHPRIMDATAGLGRDAFVLADLGCEVLMCERHAVIAELLAAGMATAAEQSDPWLDGVLSRMRLQAVDVRDLKPEGIDVIYMDPMFPARDKSAAVKKDMQLFQKLLGDAPDDAGQVLQWALQQDVARVVVKRPARAAELVGKASHCIRGKAVRYDVYVRRSLDAATIA